MNKCILMIAAALLFAACNPKTELAVKNSSSSDGAINSIVWQDSDGSADAAWGNENVAEGATSSYKEVSATDGSIECEVYSGSAFTTASVVISGESGEATSLNSGESQVVTITATDASASVSVGKLNNTNAQ